MVTCSLKEAVKMGLSVFSAAETTQQVKALGAQASCPEFIL